MARQHEGNEVSKGVLDALELSWISVKRVSKSLLRFRHDWAGWAVAGVIRGRVAAQSGRYLAWEVSSGEKEETWYKHAPWMRKSVAEGGDGQHAIRALEWIRGLGRNAWWVCVETRAQPGLELFMRSCPFATNCRGGVRSWNGERSGHDVVFWRSRSPAKTLREFNCWELEWQQVFVVCAMMIWLGWRTRIREVGALNAQARLRHWEAKASCAVGPSSL